MTECVSVYRIACLKSTHEKLQHRFRRYLAHSIYFFMLHARNTVGTCTWKQCRSLCICFKGENSSYCNFVERKRQIFVFCLGDKNERTADELDSIQPVESKIALFPNVKLILCKHTSIFYLWNSLSCDRLHRNGPIDTAWPQKEVKLPNANVSASAYSNLTCMNFQWWYLCGIIPHDLLLSSGTTLKNKKARIQCLYYNVHVENGYMRLESVAPCAQKTNREWRERFSKNCAQSSQNAKRFMAIFLRVKAIVHSKRLNWRSLNI